jgi:hypothetical protein
MNPIYQAGHKFIDLSRITAIEPVYQPSWSYCDLPSGEIHFIEKPPTHSFLYCEVHCQLHEKPIQITFPWNNASDKLPADQFQDLMNAWTNYKAKCSETPSCSETTH